MDLRKQMDSIYRNLPLESIPWNMSEPPEILAEALEQGRLHPCAAVDLGCGAGNYAIWLARKGFEMTGLDLSAEAIRHAETLAASEKVACRFFVADLLGDVTEFRDRFDFAYDWEVLHHLFPEDRDAYVHNVRSLIRPGGSYFSLCFSERDAAFGGKGKYRDTPLGTRLYFSSETELRDLFEPIFEVTELTTVEIAGKRGSHMVNAAWMTPR